VFLNRRGFAPAVRCPSCGWVAECPRCDVPLVYHQHRQRYWCHHCDHHQPASKICGHCQYDGVVPLGAGTERLEQYLAECFSDVPVRRFDRDTTKRQGSMAELLDLVHQGGAQILLGTQMLAKGHHFPDVQLAVIVDVDTGLFSVDFRATERMGQLIVQVAGRAGREQRGLVMMQTHHPEHPLLQPLLQHDYAAFSHLVMQQRQEAGLPPYAHMVLFTAESRQATRAQTCLRRISQAVPGVRCWGPIPAPMAKRDHWYRFQLLCCAAQRRDLHQAVHDMQALWRAQDDGRVRVYVDVDPQDVM
jgi:primosomal protein N' (replication factor Y)